MKPSAATSVQPLSATREERLTARRRPLPDVQSAATMQLLTRVSAYLTRPRYAAAAAAALVLVPVLAFLPYLRSMVSRNAVVVAFVYTARAPISGTLLEAPQRAGLRLDHGAAAAWVEDPRVDDELVTALRASDRAQREALVQLDLERRRLADLEARHAAKRVLYRDALARDVARRVEATKSELAGRESRLIELRNEARRMESLHRDGFAAPAAVEAARAALDDAEALQRSQREQLARLELAGEELTGERFMVEGLEGAIQTEGDLQRLRLELLALDRERSRAAADLDAMSARLSSAEKRLERVRRAPVTVPDGSVVWQVNAVPGQFVEAGSPVFSFVDCGSLLLDMRLDDSVLSLVEAGQRVRFRLFGSRQWQQAEVAMVRGSGAIMQHELTTDIGRRSRDGQVLSAIPSDASFGPAAAFCGIGRRAYAELEGIGLYHELLRRLFL